jgi:hypothetical protein
MTSGTRSRLLKGCFSFVCRSDAGLSGIALALLLSVGCRSDMNNPAKRDINAVLADHQSQLMALPEVVGVYVGARADKTPCIKVMLSRKDPEIEHRIPRTLEGYPVVTEVSGTIRPMNVN